MNETEVYGIRVVHWPNNTITIPRHNRKAIEYLNNCCDPVEGENLRWYKRVEGALPLEDFLRIRCEFAYIVGKGPSLDSISAKCFKNLGAPVIALNDSIEKIESLQLVNPIYMLQRDLAKQSSKSIHIDYACVLVPPKAQHVYPDHRRYIFQPIDFLAANENLSSQAAIALLHAKGCKTIEWCVLTHVLMGH